MREKLKADLERALADLQAHMASWEYAFAMGSACHGGAEHPTHWVTRDRTEQLERRCRELRARLAELDL